MNYDSCIIIITLIFLKNEMSIFYETSLKRKTFKMWTNFLNSLKEECLKEKIADKFNFKSICLKPFNHWKLVCIFIKQLNGTEVKKHIFTKIPSL